MSKPAVDDRLPESVESLLLPFIQHHESTCPDSFCTLSPAEVRAAVLAYGKAAAAREREEAYDKGVRAARDRIFEACLSDGHGKHEDELCGSCVALGRLISDLTQLARSKGTR